MGKNSGNNATKLFLKEKQIHLFDIRKMFILDTSVSPFTQLSTCVITTLYTQGK